MQLSKCLHLFRLLALTSLIAGICLSTTTLNAAGTTFTFSNIAALAAPDCTAGDPHVQFNLTVSVPDGASAHIYFHVTAPGAPHPVDQLSGISPNPLPGPANVTSLRSIHNNFSVGTIPSNTLIAVTYSDANSSAVAGFTVNCTTGAIAMLTFEPDKTATPVNQNSTYNPNDNRVNPQPGDRLAIWCNIGANPPNIDIWGIAENSQGFPLVTVKYRDVVAAGPHGLIKRLGKNGDVSIGVDGQNNFWIAWTGGIYGASGQGSWAKGVNCPYTH